MDQKKKNIIIGVIVVVVLLIIGFFIFKSKDEEAPVAYQRKRGGPCPGPVETYTMKDPYMKGILEVGQKFKVITNYYDCNPPQHGDLVYYQMHSSMEPVVKIIRGKEGDKISLSKDKKYNAWNLKVNGEMIYSGQNKNEPYFFGAPTPPPLSRYASSNKVIAKGDVILLSNFPPGSVDSGIFGMFNLVDVVGKVELIEGQKETTPVEIVKPEAPKQPKKNSKKSKK